MKNNSDNNQVTVAYENRVYKMTGEMMENTIQRILEKYNSLEIRSKTLKDESISAANECREVGILIKTLCGHEQINFQFWQNNCGKLAAKFDFENAKIFVAIANKMPEPAKTITEAAPVMQMILQAADILKLEARKEEHVPAAVGIFQRFLGNVTVIRQLWGKALRESPMEKWNADQVRDFLAETQWLEDERLKAEKLQGRK